MTGKKRDPLAGSADSNQKKRAEVRVEIIVAIIGAITTIIVSIIGAPWITDALRQDPTPTYAVPATIPPQAEKRPVDATGLVVSDVIVYSKGNGSYELDFRVVNNGDSDILVNRIAFEVLRIDDKNVVPVTSGISYSDVTDPSDLCYYVDKEELLEQAIAVKVEAGGVDRFGSQLTCGWTNWVLYLVVKASLRTSAGTVTYDDEIAIELSPLSDQEKKMVSAVQTANAQEVRALLNLHPDLHTIDDLFDQQAPYGDILYTAAGNGQKEIVELLLEKIPRPFDANRLGAAAGISLERGHVDILRLFLDSGLDPNTRQRIDANCWKEAADALIHAHGNIETGIMAFHHNLCSTRIQLPENLAGVSLLHKAAYYGYKDMIFLLLDFGADASLQDDNGQTAKDYALEKGYLELSRVLVAKK